MRNKQNDSVYLYISLNKYMILVNQIKVIWTLKSLKILLLPFRTEFTIVIFINYKPQIAVAILDL